MTALLQRALEALGPGASPQEVELVADTLRSARDKDVLRALQTAAEDLRAFDALCLVAEEAGASGFVALDLATAVGGDRLVK